MSIKQQSDLVRSALLGSAAALDMQAAYYRRAAEAFPNEPQNAPTHLAAALLEQHGFCVMAAVEMDEAIGVVESAFKECDGDDEQASRLGALLAYMQDQRRRLA